MRRTAVAALTVALALPVGFAAEPHVSPASPALFDPAALHGHIPEPMLGAYLSAAHAWQIDWALLAAIGTLTCDHGRSHQPGCWPAGTLDADGRRGPMLLDGTTWRTDADRHEVDVAGPPAPDGQGWATDGDNDGTADPWSTYDAVHTAARYLDHLDGQTNPRLAAKRYFAGPDNPDPTAGEHHADRTIQLIARYRELAGPDGPGNPLVDPDPAPHGPGGCTIPDPTGTGGCVTPTTAHLVTQLRRTFEPISIFCWGQRPTNPSSDHPNGRACDLVIGAIGRWPTRAERQHGWHIATWLTTHADTLAITYLVWDGQLWTPSGWRPYRTRNYDLTTPTGYHADHVHISTAR